MAVGKNVPVLVLTRDTVLYIYIPSSSPSRLRPRRLTPLMDGLAMHPLSARKCPVSWWRPRDRERTIYVGRGWKEKRLSGAYCRLWIVVSGWQRSVQMPGEF
jgi:hypothetical protein